MIEIDKTAFSKYPINNFAEIWDELIPLYFDKNTVLPLDILCFVQKGTVRKLIANLNQESSDGTSLDFYFEGDIFTAKTEHVDEQQIEYRSINRGILWYVDMEIVRRLFLESKLCSTTQKVFLEEQLRKKTLREIQLLRASPKEMYLYLLHHKPSFILQVPLKYLSSYLGITPQALSRIRKKIN